jgi:hypothetical protein
MMSTELDWTQKLGDAVLAQQPDVMAAIQRLRARAQDKGTLTTNPQQKVTVEAQAGNRRTVVIEQANDDTVYVPAYDPRRRLRRLAVCRVSARVLGLP